MAPLVARDPNGGEDDTFPVRVSPQRMKFIAGLGMGHAMDLAKTVPNILRYPTAIFEGLRYEDDEDRGNGVGWRCYCGMPNASYDRKGVPKPPLEGHVFLVFLNDDHFAYNGRWEPEDDQDKGLPSNHLERFRKRLL